MLHAIPSSDLHISLHLSSLSGHPSSSFHLSLCSCLFSKGFSWATFFQRFLLGYLFFHRFLLGHLFPKVSCGAPFFQRLFWSNLFPKYYFLDLALAALEAMLPALFANCFNSFIVSFTSFTLLPVSWSIAFIFQSHIFFLHSFLQFVGHGSQELLVLQAILLWCLAQVGFAFPKQPSKSAQTAVAMALAFFAFL